MSEFYATIIKPSCRIIALYDSDKDELSKLKQNTEYLFKVTRPRNYQFHKKFFSLINLGFANQDKIKDFNEYRTIKTMQAGFFRMIITEKGKVFIPESISFTNMDELEFQKVYNTVLEIIITETKLSGAEIDDELINYF